MQQPANMKNMIRTLPRLGKLDREQPANKLETTSNQTA
jgi:hypothetical protein